MGMKVMPLSSTEQHNLDSDYILMLLSLPTELLLEIVAHLHGDEDSQICLALTCRQMYHNVVPELRKEHAEHVQNFLIPVGFIGIYKSDLAVVPRYKGLYGVDFNGRPAEAKLNGEAGEAFQGDTGTVNVWLLPKEGKDVRAARSLLVSAPALKHIHLQIPFSCPLKVLVNTLSMCAARPSTRLTITDGLQTSSRDVTPVLGRTTSSMLDKSPAADKLWSSKLRLPEAFRHLRKDSAQLSPPYQETPAITALSIENDVLFFFEIYPYLLRLMNTAPLEFLHLGSPPAHEYRSPVPPVRQSHWTTILSSITTKATRVSFALVPLGPEDLLVFLTRHPHITHLALNITTLTGGVPFNSSPLLLPSLTTLEGVASTVLPLLTARKDGHFPALQYLILKTPTKHRNQDVKNYSLHAVYDHITSHNFQYVSVQLTSMLTSGLLSWIFSPKTGSESPLSTSALPFNYTTAQRQLINVKKLIIKHLDPRIPPDVREAAMAWSIELAHPKDQGWDDTNKAAQERPDMSAQMTEERIMESALRHACPDVAEIEFLRLPEIHKSAVEIMSPSP